MSKSEITDRPRAGDILRLRGGMVTYRILDVEAQDEAHQINGPWTIKARRDALVRKDGNYEERTDIVRVSEHVWGDLVNFAGCSLEQTP